MTYEREMICSRVRKGVLEFRTEAGRSRHRRRQRRRVRQVGLLRLISMNGWANLNACRVIPAIPSYRGSRTAGTGDFTRVERLRNSSSGEREVGVHGTDYHDPFLQTDTEFKAALAGARAADSVKPVAAPKTVETTRTKTTRVKKPDTLRRPRIPLINSMSVAIVDGACDPTRRRHGLPRDRGPIEPA